MAEAFDPYRKWLGIPPDEQPPDHYRLLGVGRFEDDADTISNAADRQMAHVRTFQTGGHSALSQKLLNEISTARLCLLDRARKAEYDARLRAKEALLLAVPAAPAAQGPWQTGAMPLAPAASPIAMSRPLVALKGTPRKKKAPVAVLVAASVLLVAIGTIAFISRQRSQPSEPQPDNPTLAGRLTDAGPARSTPTGPTDEDLAEEERAARAAAPQAPARPKLEIITAQWGAGELWQEVTDRLQQLVYGERLVCTVAGNLFQGVPDPANGTAKSVRIRYRAAGQERTAEFFEGDVIYLDGHPAAARGPSSQGLQVLDARYGAGTTWVDVLPRVRRWVHGERLAIYVDRVAQSDPLVGQRKALFIRYRTGEGEFVTHAWDYEQLAIDARPMPTAGKATDLLAAADPDRKSTGSHWRKEEHVLIGPDQQPGNLIIPVPPLDEYLLTAVFAARPCPHDVGLALPIGDRQAQVVLDGWGRTISGLQNIDGAMANQNATTRHGTFFGPGQATTLRCAVRKSSIYVTCNDRVAVDWRGDPLHLSAPPEVQTDEKSAIVVRNLGNPWQITQLDVAPLGAEPSSAAVPTDQVVDLLKQIDPKLDAVSGEWKKDGEGLLTPIGEFVRLGVPYLPPDDYELRVVAERKSGGDAFFLGLIVDGRPTFAVLDGWGGTTLGLNGLDGESYERNATTKKTRVFVDERPKELLCTVHPSSVKITCEGQTLIDWHGDARRFTSRCDVPDELGLQLGDWNTQFLISKFELRPLPPAPPQPSIDLAQPIDLLKRIDLTRDVVAGDWRKEGDAADKRKPLPAEKSLAGADRKVSEMFDRQWKAAKKFPDRMAVARRIYDAGLETTGDPVLRYALLREASRRAAVLGDASTACDAIEKLGQEFQIDTLAEKLALVSEALTKAHLGSQNWNLAMQALLLCDRAVADERFEEARKFASLAAAAGRRTRRHDLTAYADARLAHVRSRQEEYTRFARSLERLKEHPDDAEANRTAGIGFCLFQGDWKRGLPLLAHSGDERLAEIARLESAANSDAAQRTALVDAWLAEAEKHSGELRTACQLQAKYWYERGLPTDAVADAGRNSALAQLATLPDISLARVVPGLDMAMFDGGDFQQFRARRVDEQICHRFGLGSPHPSVPGDYFSIRWTGWIKPPLPGKYLIKTSSDDSIRVRINGKLVIDHWNRGAGQEQAEMELSDQFQPLTVEYNDYTEGADVCLNWSLKDLSDFQVVPPEALFHDPAVVP